jgi:hypothetical protein
MAKKKQTATGGRAKAAAGKALLTKRLSASDVSPEDALTVLIDTLSNNPIWKENQYVKVLCKMVGAHIIALDAEVDSLSTEVEDHRSDIDKALTALGCI